MNTITKSTELSIAVALWCDLCGKTCRAAEWGLVPLHGKRPGGKGTHNALRSDCCGGSLHSDPLCILPKSEFSDIDLTARLGHDRADANELPGNQAGELESSSVIEYFVPDESFCAGLSGYYDFASVAGRSDLFGRCAKQALALTAKEMIGTNYIPDRDEAEKIYAMSFWQNFVRLHDEAVKAAKSSGEVEGFYNNHSFANAVKFRYEAGWDLVSIDTDGFDDGRGKLTFREAVQS